MEATGTRPWREVFGASRDPDVALAFTSIANLNRTSWQYFLPSGRGRAALCIDEGLGATADALSPNYSTVVAMEPVLSRVQFMHRRFSQDRVANVHIVQAGFPQAPFPPQSFDLVVFSGGIERPSAAMQFTALSRAFELLRTGGHVYIAIEHRSRHAYFFEAREHRRLLRRAGFSTPQVFVAIESCHQPEFIVPIDGSPARYFFRRMDGRSTWLHRRILRWTAERLGLLARLQYAFILIASKP